MKLLHVDHPESDYLSAMLFMGFVEVLGEENVVDWPVKLSHRGIVDRYISPYPQGGMGVTAPLPWTMHLKDGHRWSDDEVADRIGEFDLVVLGSTRRYNSEALTRLIARVGRSAIRRLVIADTEDHDQIDTGLIGKYAPSVYFKRELLPSHPRKIGETRIEPCPFASPYRQLPSSTPPGKVQRTVDVAFLGGQNFPGGKPPLEAALRSTAAVVDTERRPYREYLDALPRAKMAVATRGYGWDTTRIWEIAACEGTLLVLERQPVIRPFPFEDGVTAALFGSPDELAAQVRKYLADEPLRARVAAAGYAHTLKFHTAGARAQQVLDEAFR
jgi:hypothetical protein